MIRRPRPRCGSGRQRRLIPLLLVTILLGLQAVLGTPAVAQSFSDCAQPPMLERPGDGAVGSIDPPTGQGSGPDLLYTQYGYAGFVWHTYDQQSGPVCGDPFAGFTTWLSNRVFDVAKLIVGMVNSLHYMLHGGSGFLDGMDGLVEDGASVLYQGVAVPFIGFGLLLVAVAIFLFSVKGNLASVSKATARVLVGLGVISATALSPLLYTTITDSLLVRGVIELEHNVYSEFDKDEVYLARDLLPEMLHRTIIVENWAIGEFGEGLGNEYVAKTVPELVDAQAWTWTDLKTGRDGDDAAERQKHDKFRRIAEEVKQHANYAAFSGDGSSRLGASVFALVEAICFGLFQLVCKLAILLAQIVLRMAILVGPVLGLAMFAPGVARTTARNLAGMLAQGLILTVAALAQALVMFWILQESTFGRFGNLILMAIFTVLAWKVVRPIHRLRGMAAAAAGITMPSRHEQRLEDLLRRQNRGSRGSRFVRFFRRTSAPPNWPGKGLPQHPPWPKRDPAPRPETHDAEEMKDLVVSTRRPDPGFDYIDGEAWEAHTPESRRRPELARARAGLPPGTGGRAERSGDGRGRRGGTGGGSGGGGATARAEEASSMGREVRPSELEERDRWLDAERGEAADPKPADGKTEGGKTVFTVFRPSTGRVEPNTEGAAEPRPESKGDS